MKTFLRVALGVVVALALAAGVLVYTWTRTEHGPLDVGAAIVIHTMPSEGSSDFSAENRAQMDAWVARFMPEGSPDVTIQGADYPSEGGTQPLRIYTPKGDGPFPIVLWIHGGGFFMGGDLPIWDGACSRLAAEVGALVVSVGYRLAPESPFPAAVQDSYAALLFVAEHAPAWKGDPKRIAVMGGSAGGNLAAVVAQRARDEGGPPLVYQVLVVPATYAAGEPTESRRLFSKGFGLDGIPAMVANYVPNESERANPWASPLLARDFSRLPPALVLTAEFDPLRDEGEAYAEKLRAAGVPVTVKRYPGAIHGFLGSSDDAAAADALSAEKLRQAFGATP